MTNHQLRSLPVEPLFDVFERSIIPTKPLLRLLKIAIHPLTAIARRPQDFPSGSSNWLQATSYTSRLQNPQPLTSYDQIGE